MKAFRTHKHSHTQNTHAAHTHTVRSVCTNKTCGNKFETDHINHIQVKLNTRAQLEETHTHNTSTHTDKCAHTHTYIYYTYLCIFTCSIKKILALLSARQRNNLKGAENGRMGRRACFCEDILSGSHSFRYLGLIDLFPST